ncbi:aquaporin-like protein [Aspergillus ambiguus]|uniref:aquaporin-like protein n=1 Tax=Aspergillus ambiguus TaxID=176160 RepID=UPI003CCDE2D4
MSSHLPRANFWRGESGQLPAPTEIIPFAGRIGANQEFSLDKNKCGQKELLEKIPDAAPWIPLRDSLSLKPILQIALWKAAIVEAIGTCLLVYLTSFVAVGLGQLVNTFATGALIPSLLGGLTATLVLPLFIFATGPVSGAHLNPTITIATFFGRLSTLPRCILYVSFQTFGGAIAGWLLRASFDTRSFIVPGCQFNTDKVSTGSAFTIEFTTDLALIFLSFSVGLDPRQQAVFGPALGPIFVGIVLGTCTFVTGFSRPGYTGFSGNPARCFGAMVGSHFDSYHWIHWIAPLAASITHGLLYYLIPPYLREKESTANGIPQICRGTSI